MASGAQTVHVKVELDAEAFQDAVQDAIDRAARAATITPTEHVRPEEVRVDDVLMVPVRVVSVRPPSVDGDPSRPHVHAIPVGGAWAVNSAGRLWTHGWSASDIVGHKLERLVQP